MLRSVLAALVLATVAVGCGGPPAANALLTETETAYLEAESAPDIARSAPVALADARDALARARAAQAEKQKPEAVTHLAYLARQRVRIAEETARLNASAQDIERARAERQQVQLEARTAEAEAAQRSAEAQRAAAVAAQASAEAQRVAAEAALRRAQELAAQVTDLQAQLTNRGLVLTLGDVLFDTAEATLKTGGLRAVDRLVSFLNDYPQRTVLIEGFTDEVGSDESNRALSERRAASVRQALLDRGVASLRVQTRGYGEAFPVASNGTPEGRQQNRRVEVVISDDTGAIPARQ